MLAHLNQLRQPHSRRAAQGRPPPPSLPKRLVRCRLTQYQRPPPQADSLPVRPPPVPSLALLEPLDGVWDKGPEGIDLYLIQFQVLHQHLRERLGLRTD